jgi:hypothetical protein
MDAEDPHIRALLDASNIAAGEQARCLRILDELLRANDLAASDVLALSLARHDRLVVVCARGIVQGEETGRLRKRINLGTLVTHECIGASLSHSSNVDLAGNHREYSIELRDPAEASIWRAGWTGWFDRPDEVSAVAARDERDRVAAALLGNRTGAG